MTGQHDREAAVAAARRLTGSLDGVHAELKRLNAYTHRTRHIVWAIVVSLVLDLILTAVVVIGSVQLEHNKATLTQVHATQVSACAIGNRLRDEQRQLWYHIVAVSKPPPHLTVAQARKRTAALAAFLGYVRKVLPALDCARLYRLP